LRRACIPRCRGWGWRAAGNSSGSGGDAGSGKKHSAGGKPALRVLLEVTDRRALQARRALRVDAPARWSKAAPRAAFDHLMLTSLTSNTTAWLAMRPARMSVP